MSSKDQSAQSLHQLSRRQLLPVVLGCSACGAPASVMHLNGPWLMRDFARGAGVGEQVQLPGRMPKDCLPMEVPGTVREALRKAGVIPDPYVGYRATAKLPNPINSAGLH
jgi:hypothetical protein